MLEFVASVLAQGKQLYCPGIARHSLLPHSSQSWCQLQRRDIQLFFFLNSHMSLFCYYFHKECINLYLKIDGLQSDLCLDEVVKYKNIT